MWFWLARIIKGRSQHVKTRRGVDNVSIAVYNPREVQPVSDMFLIQVKLSIEIIKLYDSVKRHRCGKFESQVTGISIKVGIKIFIIEGWLMS